MNERARDNASAGADVVEELRGPWYPLRVARVVPETADARSIVLEIPDALRELFRYRAGQFLSFRIEVDGHKLVRCYSLASAPDIDPEHKVTVKRVEGGLVSNWMNEHPRPGDVLQVMRPAGLFCLREREGPLVLFSGGSGITPVISIVKTALATTRRPIRLVYANRDADSIIFRSELEALTDRHPDRLAVIHHLDVDEGFLDAEGVRRIVGPEPPGDFYICGPGPFMDTVEQTLTALGVDRDRIFIERFESPAGGAPAEDDASADPEPLASEDAAPETVIVHLDGERREIPYEQGQTVLQMARKAGLEPPFACEEGYCGCCMAHLKTGTVHMKANDCLDASEVAAGNVLTCQSLPTSRTVEVEYPD